MVSGGAQGVAAPDTAEGGEFHHRPVLPDQVCGLLPERVGLIVDATIGGGGHAEAMLAARPEAELLGCDRDGEAVDAAQRRLAGHAARVLIKQLRFSELASHVQAGSVDFLLADLGMSSPQLDRAQRGFSFAKSGPLDMRMDAEGQGATAHDLVNRWSAQKLEQLLRELGEERFARRIARAIVDRRKQGPIDTTEKLAALISGAVPRKHHQRIHPATRTFQALRMEVNDELGELRRLLEMAPDILAPRGRIAIISFHSLEDRMVKTAFRNWADPCVCPPRMPACVCGKVSIGHMITRKPLGASEDEKAANPRSRSAKLRGFEMA